MDPILIIVVLRSMLMKSYIVKIGFAFMEPAQHNISPVADSTCPSNASHDFHGDDMYFHDEIPSVPPGSDQLTVSHCESQTAPTLCSPGVRNCNPTPDKICTLDVVRQFRSKNLIISHYNVNSIIHKFCEISPITNDFGVDKPCYSWVKTEWFVPVGTI